MNPRNAGKAAITHTRDGLVLIRPKMLVLGKAALNNFEDVHRWVKVYLVIGPTIETGDYYTLQELGAILFPDWVGKTAKGATIIEYQAVKYAYKALVECRGMSANTAVAPYAAKRQLQFGNKIYDIFGYTNIPNKKALNHVLLHWQAIEDGIEENKQRMLEMCSKSLQTRLKRMQQFNLSLQLEQKSNK